MRCIVCRETVDADEIRHATTRTWQCPRCGSWQAATARASRAGEVTTRQGERRAPEWITRRPWEL